jgi:Arc/MetJ-type ribon-helix-helix transcriptional regulator
MAESSYESDRLPHPRPLLTSEEAFWLSAPSRRRGGDEGKPDFNSETPVLLAPVFATMSSGKEINKDKFSQVVKFAPTESDQALKQAIERTLETGEYSNFSELCKQALRQLVSTQTPSVRSDVTLLQSQVSSLQKQMRSLQMQLARLEGALGMQQRLSLGSLEHQMSQLEERLMQQTAQLSDRLEQMESRLASHNLPTEPEEVPVHEFDPLLTRLVPLLEDF